MSSAIYKTIKKEILEVNDRFPFLSEDNAFVVWYLRNFIAENEQEAVEAITGSTRDKGLDAIYIDRKLFKIYILQGKFHSELNKYNEPRSDVLELASTARILMSSEKAGVNTLKENSTPTVQKLLDEVYKLIHQENYSLHSYFITTGKVSDTHVNDAEERLEDWEEAIFDSYTGADLINQMQDFLLGLSPPVPEIKLQISDKFFHESDNNTNISSFIFSIKGSEISKVFLNPEIGERLFARNIRGYQGETKVNSSIQETIQKRPNYFWYLNNGITIIGDNARQITEKGKNIIRVKNAQVINGQQTTRSLASNPKKNAKTSVLVKLFVIPRSTPEEAKQFENLINNIVAATNWQNAISQADLRSNDQIQVDLQRDLKKLGYCYLRKKRLRSESRKLFGTSYFAFFDKEDVAQWTAACIFDPFVVRNVGKKRLFEDPYYYQIFEKRSAFEFIIYYWLQHYTTGESWKDPRRSYAKWVVMHFINRFLQEHLKTKTSQRKFIHLSERRRKYKRESNYLKSAINHMFYSALAFYKDNRKRDKGFYDESLFFKTRNLDARFEQYYNSNKNSFRRRMVKKNTDKFISEMNRLEL